VTPIVTTALVALLDSRHAARVGPARRSARESRRDGRRRLASAGGRRRDRSRPRPRASPRSAAAPFSRAPMRPLSSTRVRASSPGKEDPPRCPERRLLL